MPRTLTPQSAVRVLAARYPRLDSSDVAARLCDEVIAHIWLRYPWPQSLASLPPFHLIAGECDYTPPLHPAPADLYGLHQAWVRHSGGSTHPLQVCSRLDVSTTTGPPTEISYHPELRGFRIHPRSSYSFPDYWVEGVYKKLPVKITPTNMNSTYLPWDDLYFNVFRAGLLWKIRDDLLGEPDADKDFARFNYLLQQMAIAEGVHSGVSFIHPAEGLEM